MTIGENLRQLRLQKGLTQEQAAAKLHITRQALSSYESQRTQPDIHMLLALAEVYETDLDGILYGQETSLKNLRRLRTLALWLLALLTGLSILSAAFLWSANAFFPLTGGQLEQMETAVAIHFRLTDAWETLDGFILLLSNLGFLGLLLLKQMGKCNLSLGRRVALIWGPWPGGLCCPVWSFPCSIRYMPLSIMGSPPCSYGRGCCCFSLSTWRWIGSARERRRHNDLAAAWGRLRGDGPFSLMLYRPLNGVGFSI